MIHFSSERLKQLGSEEKRIITNLSFEKKDPEASFSTIKLFLGIGTGKKPVDTVILE
jgi:hypothetical protein